MSNDVSWCCMCKQYLPISEFHRSTTVSTGLQTHCKSCGRNNLSSWRHKTGRQTPYNKKRTCSMYLGVHIAERLLSLVFVGVTKMPMNNSGYDFVCGKGFKVDVKSSTLKKRSGLGNNFWMFTIDRNRIPDYFAFIAFNDRVHLTPLHFWIVPEHIVNGKTGVSITNSQEVLLKWKQYEKPINKLIESCNLLKVVV